MGERIWQKENFGSNGGIGGDGRGFIGVAYRVLCGENIALVLQHT